MKQKLIGNTSISEVNKDINTFMETRDIDYFEDEDSMQGVLNSIRRLGYIVDISDCECFISGKELEPVNIPALADTTKEAIFIAVDCFVRLKNEGTI